MGIATFAFPIGNGVIGAFAAAAFKGGTPHVALAFAPFLIIFIIGLIIGVVFIPDYPEQVGAYRDNDASMTPEVAKAMMEEEIENKKTTVWKLNHTLTTRDFWFITIPAGALLFFSVGMMTQSNAIIATMGEAVNKFGGFSGIMLMICIFGIIGSFVLGLLDSALGTKKAMTIACVIMVIAGILGALSSPERAGLWLASLTGHCLLVLHPTLPYLAAQYWRREDFGTVFAAVNPVANLINALGPMVVGQILLLGFGYKTLFGVTAVGGVISVSSNDAVIQRETC